MLAYSSIAHAGYLLIGVDRRRRAAAWRAMLIYLLIYTFMQMGAFAVVILLASGRRHRRRAQGPERALRQAAVRGRRHADLHAVARRHPADGRVHGQVLAVQRGDRRQLRLAGRARRAQQRHLPLLLPARGRLHVHEERGGRVAARAGAWPRGGARGRAGRHPDRSGSTRGRSSSWPSSRPAPSAWWAWRRRRSRK
ncbi:MAG: hypothetical protein MZU84_04135 [Sphingobacterium sp.]|nr:hypothetical protein [Sphingobacterium sp.]